MSAGKLNLILLAVIVVLATVLVLDRLGGVGQRTVPAFAQPAAGGGWIMATSGNIQGATGPFMAWLYNTQTNRLIVYQLKGTMFQLLYVRDTRYENNPEILEWTGRGVQAHPRVDEIRKEIEKKR